MPMISGIRQIVRYWWLFLLLGGLLLLFALLVFSQPLTAYAGLALYFVFAFFVNGFFEVCFGMMNRGRLPGWGWHLAGGLFDLLAAGVLFFTPVLAAVSLPYFAGFWLLFRSISIVGRCFDLPVAWQERAWMCLLGFVGIGFSFMLLYNPAVGALTLVAWTGCALVAVGLFYIFLGLHLRSWSKSE